MNHDYADHWMRSASVNFYSWYSAFEVEQAGEQSQPNTRKICSVQHLSTWTATCAASSTPDRLHSPGHKVNSVVSRRIVAKAHIWKGA